MFCPYFFCGWDPRPWSPTQLPGLGINWSNPLDNMEGNMTFRHRRQVPQAAPFLQWPSGQLVCRCMKVISEVVLCHTVIDPWTFIYILLIVINQFWQEVWRYGSSGVWKWFLGNNCVSAINLYHAATTPSALTNITLLLGDGITTDWLVIHSPWLAFNDWEGVNGGFEPFISCHSYFMTMKVFENPAFCNLFSVNGDILLVFKNIFSSQNGLQSSVPLFKNLRQRP